MSVEVLTGGEAGWDARVTAWAKADQPLQVSVTEEGVQLPHLMAAADALDELAKEGLCREPIGLVMPEIPGLVLEPGDYVVVVEFRGVVRRSFEGGTPMAAMQLWTAAMVCRVKAEEAIRGVLADQAQRRAMLLQGVRR